MHFAWLLVLASMGMSTQIQAKQADSTEYQQCLNFSFGDQSKVEKCVKKELKAQKDALKNAYKTYIKLNPIHEDTIKTQQKLWERQVEQKCQRFTQNIYARLQQQQCVLAQVTVQTQYYTSRSFQSGFRN